MRPQASVSSFSLCARVALGPYSAHRPASENSSQGAAPAVAWRANNTGGHAEVRRIGRRSFTKRKTRSELCFEPDDGADCEAVATSAARAWLAAQDPAQNEDEQPQAGGAASSTDVLDLIDLLRH